MNLIVIFKSKVIRMNENNSKEKESIEWSKQAVIQSLKKQEILFTRSKLHTIL